MTNTTMRLAALALTLLALPGCSFFPSATCGGQGEPCCSNSACGLRLTCDSNSVCDLCGGLMQQCCGGSSCDDGFTCDNVFICSVPVVPDAGPIDAGFTDAGPIDAGFTDAGPIDAGFTDAGPIDAGFTDAGPIDAGPIDAGPIDAGPIDAGPIDAGFTDAGFTDAGFTDAGNSRRYPLGIYALFPSPLSDAGFEAPLFNSAVSGIAIGIGWDALNPYMPTQSELPPAAGFCGDTSPATPTQPYDWRVLDAAFCAVETWNAAEMPQKTIQLIIPPGFHTPAWVFGLLEPSCDPLFDNPPKNPGPCGWATFLNSEGKTNPYLAPLPLSWNAQYLDLWTTFLEALEARYGSHTEFVGISIAGPTGSSTEVIVPHSNIPFGSEPSDGGDSPYPIPDDDAGLSQPAMWETLISSPEADPAHYSDPAYQQNDEIFVEAWDQMIAAYERIFPDVTLTLATGSGLPDYDGGPPETVPAPFGPDCSRHPSTDCAAETAIESYLVEPAAAGNPFKATQTSGLTASRMDAHLGMDGVRLLSAQPYSPRILGGAELDTSFSNHTLAEGCPMPFPPPGCKQAGPAKCSSTAPEGCFPLSCVPADCYTGPQNGGYVYQAPPGTILTPEQACYNVLQLYFEGTPAGPLFNVADGGGRLNYLEVYVDDILYADEAGGTVTVSVDGGPQPLTAEQLLLMASHQIFETTSVVPGD